MKTYIKERAKEKGISLADIFSKLGLKSYPSFLRTLDTGENLKLKQLQIIAERLGCSLDDLVTPPGTSPQQPVCPHCGKPISIKIEG